MLSALPREEENDSVAVRLGVRFVALDGLTDENVVVLGRPQDLCRVLLIVDDRRHPDVLFPAARKSEGDVRHVELISGRTTRRQGRSVTPPGPRQFGPTT